MEQNKEPVNTVKFDEVYMPKDIVIDGKSMSLQEFQSQQRETRAKRLFEMDVLEYIDLKTEGVEINGGYTFNLNGNLAEFADGIVKLALELDKDKESGENAGDYLITLISQFYARQSGRIKVDKEEQ